MTDHRTPDGGALGDAVDPLDEALVAKRLDTVWLGKPHIHVAVCSSTNDLVTTEARAGAAEGLVVTADAQTEGRGRLGRTWHSPPGANLHLSFLLRPQQPATQIPPLTLLVGGAVAMALLRLGFEARVKWPNDVLLCTGGGADPRAQMGQGGPVRWRKVAGILTEASTDGDRVGHVVVGVGLNVNIAAFPEELIEKATSLRLARDGVPVNRVEVLARLLGTLEEAYDRFRSRGPAAAIELWEAHADLGRRCRALVGGRAVEGVTTGVAPDGALLLRDDRDVEHRIVAGEVVGVDARDAGGDHPLT